MCPRCGEHPALIDKIYGILPCKEVCQNKDKKVKLYRKFYIASLSKLDRVQRQRDTNGKDILQPYDGNKINRDFFVAYPEQVKNYKAEKELIQQ